MGRPGRPAVDRNIDTLGYCPRHATATEDTCPTTGGVREFPIRSLPILLQPI